MLPITRNHFYMFLMWYIVNMSLLHSSESPGILCWNHSIDCTLCPSSNSTPEDPIEDLRHYSYGIALPSICLLGIIGNVLNLVVLTRRNMRGTAYIYMRGKFSLFTWNSFSCKIGLELLVNICYFCYSRERIAFSPLFTVIYAYLRNVNKL